MSVGQLNTNPLALRYRRVVLGYRRIGLEKSVRAELVEALRACRQPFDAGLRQAQSLAQGERCCRCYWHLIPPVRPEVSKDRPRRKSPVRAELVEALYRLVRALRYLRANGVVVV